MTVTRLVLLMMAIATLVIVVRALKGLSKR